MSAEFIDRPTMPCGVCHAQVTELRRGRCWGCYTRWGEARPVGTGASCVICTERRRNELRMVELHARSHPLCHSCAGKISRLANIPSSVQAIRSLLERERRADERRGQGQGQEGGQPKEDHRIFPRERRVGERRAEAQDVAGGTAAAPDHLADLEDIVIELHEGDIEGGAEQTVVREGS